MATAFVAGPLEVDPLVDRGAHVLGGRPRWLRPLARRVAARFGDQTRPRVTAVARFLLADRALLRAALTCQIQPGAGLGLTPEMAPLGPAARWRTPSLCNTRELAGWLGLPVGELEWFADLRSLESRQREGPLRHYHYRPLTKRFGQTRLIEAPKPRLKAIQRVILAELLDHVPPHPSAHGFCRGGSVRTFAAPHAGRPVVLKIDLEDFFPSIAAARVRALLRAIGYPERVADLLAGLCTNAVPPDVWKEAGAPATGHADRQLRRYAQPHLPQGAPTSPALANLCAYRLDCRLAGLAEAAGGVYTRYADDLAFSGGDAFARCVGRFQTHVCATAMEEGFAVNHYKTRVMRRGQRQQIAGLVVNHRPGVARDQRDRLRATLTNCVRHGPASQNREAHADFRAHLNGRVAFVEMVSPEQGQRLRRLFEEIRWEAGCGV
ncbi:reverse transcriptase family protein [Pirellulimonas nuda]|uniref:reverse transcriptase family protein n=1 Tax=Pirellulimonas nuda TaxID=2528009 RepID=UPI0018D4D7BE|nr:reverse transcriptase family protein [Pirellulimonas nuda]